MQKILVDLMGTMDMPCTSPDRQKDLRDTLLFTELEQTLLDRLGEGGFNLLMKYNSAAEKAGAQETTEAFVRGFRYGARLMAAVFDDEFI